MRVLGPIRRKLLVGLIPKPTSLDLVQGQVKTGVGALEEGFGLSLQGTGLKAAKRKHA